MMDLILSPEEIERVRGVAMEDWSCSSSLMREYLPDTYADLRERQAQHRHTLEALEEAGLLRHSRDLRLVVRDGGRQVIDWVCTDNCPSCAVLKEARE